MALTEIAEPNFAGEVSVARCQVPGIVACALAGRRTSTPWSSARATATGRATTAGARKRVYVQVTE